MQKPSPIRKLIVRDFSWLCSSTAYIILLRTVHTFLLKEKNEPIVPSRPESPISSDYSSEEDQDLATDNEPEFRDESSRYQASPTLRRPNILSLHAESGRNSED